MGPSRNGARGGGHYASETARSGEARLLPKGKAAIGIEIDDFALCPRYSALVFENVTVQPSPLWLQYRLEAIGLNAINNIVDVTNYVMAELAQPMHAFDADEAARPHDFRSQRARRRTDRRAERREATSLSPSNLVIADAEGPIAIAGVIGGLDSAIGPDTTRIVLESANFQAASVRKTSVALKLRTDASMRFEKSQDPVNTVRGLARALELLEQVSPGIRLVGGVADRTAELKTRSSHRTDGRLAESQAGARSGRAARCGRFSNRSNSASTKPRRAISWSRCRAGARPRTSRSRTILLEEVGRMVGYDSITPRAPLIESVVPPANPSRKYAAPRYAIWRPRRDSPKSTTIRSSAKKWCARSAWTSAEHVGVTNPIASDQTLLRASLLPAIRKNILDNSRHFQSFRLFEIGREIHARDRELPAGSPALRRGDVRARRRRQRGTVRAEASGRMFDGRMRSASGVGPAVRTSRARRDHRVARRRHRASV